MLPLSRFLIVIVFVVLVVACGRPAPVPEYEPELPVLEEETDLLTQWREIPRAGHEYMDIPRAVQISGAMAQSGPDGLAPLLEIIEDAQEDPVTKMLAVICLTPYLDEAWLPRLLSLTAPEYDSVTRGCAVHLVGAFPSEDVLEELKAFLTDEDDHVRKVATFALLRHGDEDAVAKTRTLWDAPDTSSHDRNEIVLAFPDARAARHLDMFQAAACLEGLDDPARKRAIQLLGSLAGAEALPDLEACYETENDEALRELLRGAIDAIRARAAAVPDRENGAD